MKGRRCQEEEMGGETVGKEEEREYKGHSNSNRHAGPFEDV